MVHGARNTKGGYWGYMSIKINLKDIQLSQLNPECVLLINRFIRALKAHDGTVLKIQEKDILMQISEQARRTDNDELAVMYKELKEKILVCVHAELAGKR